MDVVKLRAQHRDKLVIRGGIDKCALAKGKDAIDRELDGVLPIFVETDGYSILLDHSSPPDVSPENCLHFLSQAKTYG